MLLLKQHQRCLWQAVTDQRPEPSLQSWCYRKLELMRLQMWMAMKSQKAPPLIMGQLQNLMTQKQEQVPQMDLKQGQHRMQEQGQLRRQVLTKLQKQELLQILQGCHRK